MPLSSDYLSHYTLWSH